MIASAPGSRAAASATTLACRGLMAPPASAARVRASGPTSSRAVSIRACAGCWLIRSADAYSSRAASWMRMSRSPSVSGGRGWYSCRSSIALNAASPSTCSSCVMGCPDTAATVASASTAAIEATCRARTCTKVIASSGASADRSTASSAPSAGRHGGIASSASSSPVGRHGGIASSRPSSSPVGRPAPVGTSIPAAPSTASSGTHSSSRSHGGGQSSASTQPHPPTRSSPYSNLCSSHSKPLTWQQVSSQDVHN